MNISRSINDRLRELARHFPVVLVTGARQTGKTTLLRDCFPDARFATLDLPSVAHAAENDGAQFLADFGDDVAVLDEVQYAPMLFRYLKAAVDADRHRMGRFLMTGSQKFALMKSASESLAGRCAILELDTLSITEVRQAFGKKTPPVEEFLWRGGYPELHRNTDLRSRDFFAGYLATYLERDVRQIMNVGSLRDFERFLRACALRSANLVNMADLARDVGIAGSTARDWLSVLEASNIIVMLEPYFTNHGKRMIKTPKLYFRDTGLLCFLLGIDSPEHMTGSPFIGALWETFVLGQLLRSKNLIGSAAMIYFWRDAHGTEVDFLIEQNGRLRLVEVKWAEDVSAGRGLHSLQVVRDLLGHRAAAEHWLICRTAHDHTHPQVPGLRVINGYKFNTWLGDAEPLHAHAVAKPPTKAKKTSGVRKKTTRK